MADTVQPSLKEKVVQALNTFKLRHMAVAVVGAAENVDAIVSAMSGQVEAEVADRVSKDPLVMACEAAGVKTPADMSLLLDRAKMGDDWLDELKADAKKQAIRAYGSERGLVVSAQLANLDHRSVKVMRDAWSAEADARFDIGQDGKPAPRASAPAAQRESVPATQEPTAETKWEQISADQRALGERMGMNTPEKREVFAAEYLAAAQGA